MGTRRVASPQRKIRTHATRQAVCYSACGVRAFRDDALCLPLSLLRETARHGRDGPRLRPAGALPGGRCPRYRHRHQLRSSCAASIDAALASSYLKTRYPVVAPRHGHEPQSLKGSGCLQALTKRSEAFFWGAPWGVPSKEHGHAPLKRTGDVRLFRHEAILRPHVLESRHAAMADSQVKHREVVDGEVKRSA